MKPWKRWMSRKNQLRKKALRPNGATKDDLLGNAGATKDDLLGNAGCQE